MSSQDQERERIRRIRERQIQVRDPRATYQKAQRAVARRGRRRQKRVTLWEMFTDIPQKWKGLIVGVLIGCFIAVVLPLLWVSEWATLIGFATIPVFAIVGLAFGQAFELRDELRDISRRK
jgi:uncharacterized membrane protein YraQ (UPF0718 family)